MCMIGDFKKMRNVRRGRPIVAYRTFRPHLRSMFKPFKWNNGTVTVADYAPSDRWPAMHSGLWAFKTAAKATHMRDSYHVKGRVKKKIRKVLLWGIVAEHKLGYRAQYGLVSVRRGR